MSEKRNPTGQQIPLEGYEERMVANNEGGYVFEVEEESLLRRWLLLGSEDGSYYESPLELTEKNIDNLLKLVKKDPARVLAIANEHLENGWYIKPFGLMATYAVLTTSGVSDEAFEGLKKLATTPWYFFKAVEYLKIVRGFGSRVKKFVKWWYNERNFERVVYQTIKYPSRGGWTHRDTLLLGHVKPVTERHQELYSFLVSYAKGESKFEDIPSLTPFAEGVKKVWSVDSDNVEEISRIVEKYRLTWDVLPTEVLNHKELWEMMIVNDLVPAVALLRQLRRLRKLGIGEELVAEKLWKNYDNYSVYQLLKAYASLGVKGRDWNEDDDEKEKDEDGIIHPKLGKIVGEMIEEKLWKNKVSTKPYRLLVGVDVSASMYWPLDNFPMWCVSFARVFGNYLTRRFEGKYVEFDVDVVREDSFYNLMDVVTDKKGGFGTDLGIPFEIALKNARDLDGVVILTDNVTWAGDRHVEEYLQKIREINPRFKAINVAMVANEFTVLDPREPRNLEVAGPVENLDVLIEKFMEVEV